MHIYDIPEDPRTVPFRCSSFNRILVHHHNCTYILPYMTKDFTKSLSSFEYDLTHSLVYREGRALSVCTCGHVNVTIVTGYCTWGSGLQVSWSHGWG